MDSLEGSDKDNPRVRLALAVVQAFIMEASCRFVYDDLKAAGYESSNPLMRELGHAIGRAGKIRSTLEKVQKETQGKEVKDENLKEAD